MYIYIFALEMASPGKQHCANCIGTVSFPVRTAHCRPWQLHVGDRMHRNSINVCCVFYLQFFNYVLCCMCCVRLSYWIKITYLLTTAPANVRCTPKTCVFTFSSVWPHCNSTELDRKFARGCQTPPSSHPEAYRVGQKVRPETDGHNSVKS